MGVLEFPIDYNEMLLLDAMDAASGWWDRIKESPRSYYDIRFAGCYMLNMRHR